MNITKQTKEGIVPMKSDKRVRLFLVGAVITSFGVFAVNGYISKNANGNTNQTVPRVSKQIQSALDLGNSLKHINIKQQVPQVAIAELPQPKVLDKQPLNRGGSGLPEEKVETKTQIQVKPKQSTTSKLQQKTASKAKTVASAKIKPKPLTETIAVIGTSYKLSLEERDLFYRLVNAETEGEPYQGKLAVATVIINRVRSSEFPNTVRGVIMDKAWGYQFTPVIDGRINVPASAEAKKAVDEVVEGKRSFSSNVLYFVNPRKAVSSWIMENKTYYKSIGNHDFYY